MLRVRILYEIKLLKGFLTDFRSKTDLTIDSEDKDSNHHGDDIGDQYPAEVHSKHIVSYQAKLFNSHLPEWNENAPLGIHQKYTEWSGNLHHLLPL